MTLVPDTQGYIERVKAAAVISGSLENLPSSRAPSTEKPVASWFNGTSLEIHDLKQVLVQAKADQAASRNAICVVENIDWNWITTLGKIWDVEPQFFADHGVSPQGEDPWATLFPRTRDSDVRKGPSKHKHVDGVFEHHHLPNDASGLDRLKASVRHSTYSRRCWTPKSSHPPSSCTRMSYCRVNGHLYLFLVDPPPSIFPCDDQVSDVKIAPSMWRLRPKTTLRVQCASRGGIMLPQLLKRKIYNMRQVLHSIFRHAWHLRILFDQKLVRELAMNRGELLHLMSASLHQTNLQTIDQEIKAISFRELRNPDMATNAKLLTLREVLSDLVSATSDASKYVPSHVRQFYEALYNSHSNSRDNLNFHSPVEKLASLKQQANELDRFLMDSFQLLMSSISVIETQIGAEQTRISMQQAARTTRLTQLAFVYVPLTFVTSIFGMNVKGLTDDSNVPPIWVCFVTLVIVAVATAALFGGYEILNGLRKRDYNKALDVRRNTFSSHTKSLTA